MVEAFLKSLNNASKGQSFLSDFVTFLIKSFQTSDSKRVFAFFLYPTELVSIFTPTFNNKQTQSLCGRKA